MVEIDGKSLDLESYRSVVFGGAPCRMSAAAGRLVAAARNTVLETLERDQAVYGVNTGFGDLARVRIEADKLSLLQERLILSHCAGVGDPLPGHAVRGMLLLRANTLSRGHSGVRAEIIDALLTMLNANVLPVVPSRGSVGASGDLAPLAHLAAPLLGKGTVTVGGIEMTAGEGLDRAGLTPFQLEPKEGLALINGTQAMTALLANAVFEIRRLVRISDLVAALSVDALRGTDAAFDPRLHALRPYVGQQTSAANLWMLLSGSEIRESHRIGDVRVQDPYSLRCAPQVHGAARDLLTDAEYKLAIEMNAVTDNPLIFPDDGAIVSGGNFHGEPIAMAADTLCIGVAELGNISERRIEKLTNTAFSGLPPFLVEDAGLNSGFMMAQVTAAALASENKVYAHPASVDSIPTSADKEDHVSMGMGATLKLENVISNTITILAIELLCAAQGIDLLRPLRSSPALEELHAGVRQHVDTWHEDRQMSADIGQARRFLDEIDPYLRKLG
ncbi:MAG: histidine ammonia-lyase [Gammaproteobacteria bacterium]|nr:histidine ammonia-lyase [Gammaproteobacteria bacterium]